MGDGTGRGRERGWNGERIEVRKMGVHENIARKRNRFGI